jgi:hypothetical protein
MEPISVLLTTALEYILKGAAQSKTAGNAKEEILGRFWKWSKKFFIKEVPEIEKTPDSAETKARAEQRLQELIKDESFIEELKQQIEQLQKAGIDAGTGDHITGNDNQTYRMEKLIQESDVTVKGNMQIGGKNTTHYSIDTIHSGSGDIVKGNKNIINNYAREGQISRPDLHAVKHIILSQVQQGNTEDAITQLVEHTENLAPYIYKDALQLSGQFQALHKKQTQGVLSDSKTKQELQEINTALIMLLNKID